MPEFFITARSFAAPFVSDTSEKYVEAPSVNQAMATFSEGYSHPCGLYAFEVWANADDYHKRKPPLDQWLSAEALASKEDGGRDAR